MKQIRTTGNGLYRLILSAAFLALALVLPLLTGQIKEFGNALCPMHLPVMLCGYFCGGWYGAAVGLAAPLLRSFLFGMPQLFPSAVGMAAELCTYGLVCGLLYRAFPKKIGYVYVSLAAAMLAGRAVWGGVRFALAGISGTAFPFSAFLAGAFTSAVPGMILQIVLIPPLVLALSRFAPVGRDGAQAQF